MDIAFISPLKLSLGSETFSTVVIDLTPLREALFYKALMVFGVASNCSFTLENEVDAAGMKGESSLGLFGRFAAFLSGEPFRTNFGFSSTTFTD